MARKWGSSCYAIELTGVEEMPACLWVGCVRVITFVFCNVYLLGGFTSPRCGIACSAWAWLLGEWGHFPCHSISVSK